MNPRRFTLVLSLLFFLALATRAAEPPNVILVITDDQGYGDLSCHGNPILKTPHLDKLHSRSVRLTDFHVAPMCTPTRSQLLTGRHCLVNGAMNVSSGRTLLRRGIPTLPEILAASGYRTGLFGKWHLGDNYPYRPMDRGFQEALWFPSSHIGSAPDYWNNDYFDDTYHHNGRRKAFQGYCTDVFFDEAIGWMKRQTGQKKPFFCYIALNAPHGPLFVPQKYRDMFPDRPRNVASYYGMLVNIDENIGKLDGFLEKSGLRDNTLLIFMTDNGGTVGVNLYNAGMRGRKIELYDGGHRVPCFIRWPKGGLRPPGDVAELTQAQDILPTLIDLIGLKKPAGAALEGLSLARLLRGQEDRLPDRKLVIQFSRMNGPRPAPGDAAVLWKRWRLVADKELYNLETDAAQENNVIEQHPEVARELRTHYQEWWKRIEPAANVHSAIIIGADAENPIQLSPADWEDVFLDQGGQVRRADRKNGHWNIEVDRNGEYEIELRRWAREADTAITSGLDPLQHADGEFPAGAALPIAAARLKIGGFEEVRTIEAADKKATFQTGLQAGPTELHAWFEDKEGKTLCGAYYVYVRRK